MLYSLPTTGVSHVSIQNESHSIMSNYPEGLNNNNNNNNNEQHDSKQVPDNRLGWILTEKIK